MKSKFNEAVDTIMQIIAPKQCDGCGTSTPKYFDQFPNFCPSCGRRSSHENYIDGQIARMTAGYDPQTVDLGPDVKAVVSKCGCGFKLPNGEQTAFCPGCGNALRGAGTLNPLPRVEPKRKGYSEEDELLGL